MKNQSGSGLIFAVVLLFVILGMVVTLSSVTVLETKMNQKTKSSVGAFYNADSGVEWALNKIATSPSSTTVGSISCPFDDCKVYFLGSDGKVLVASATIDQVKAVRSVGTQGGETQRAIEAAVAATGGGTYTAFGTNTCDQGTEIYQGYAMTNYVAASGSNSTGGGGIVCKKGNVFSTVGTAWTLYWTTGPQQVYSGTIDCVVCKL